MDLGRSVIYRGVNLNSVTLVNGVLSGIAIERVKYGNVPGVGYTEKRSLGDGNDASDVFLGPRRLLMEGHVYGANKGELFDLQQVLVTALNPASAFQADPGDFGYHPMYYYVPTEDLNYPLISNDRLRPLYISVRPLASPDIDIVKDRTGGGINSPGSVPWSCIVEARDPRIYVWPELEAALAGTSDGGTLTNRGDYPAPINVLFVAPIRASAGTWTLQIAGSQMRITLPISTVAQTYRYSGQLKVLTVEEDGDEVLRMDLLTFLNDTTHPLLLPGANVWTSSSGSISLTSGRIWVNEAYA